MNEQEALQLSFDIAVENGFQGSLEDYKKSLNNPEKLNQAFDQAKDESYPGEIEGFAKMLGVDMEVLGEGKSNGVVAEDATVAPEMQASENTVSESENTSLEQPKKIVEQVLSEPNQKIIDTLDKEISKSIPLTVTDVTTETKSLEDDFISLQNQKKKNPEFGYQEEIEIQKQKGPQRFTKLGTPIVTKIKSKTKDGVGILTLQDLDNDKEKYDKYLKWREITGGDKKINDVYNESVTYTKGGTPIFSMSEDEKNKNYEFSQSLTYNLDVENTKTSPKAIANFTEKYILPKYKSQDLSQIENIEEIENATSTAIAGAINDDPIIQKMYFEIQLDAQPKIDKKIKELKGKYNVNSAEGNNKANEELQNFAKSITQDKLFENEDYIKRVKEISKIGQEAMGGINQEFKRYSDNFLRNLDEGREASLFPESAYDLVESVYKGIKRAGSARTSAEISIDQIIGKGFSEDIELIQKALDEGKVKNSDVITSSVGNKTVKQSLLDLEKKKKYWKKEILEDLEKLNKKEEYISLFKSADLEDGDISFSDVVMTVGEALPQIGMAAAASAGSIAVTIGSGGALAPVIGSLGTVAMFGTMYGDAYMDAINTELEEEYGDSLNDLTEDQKRNLIYKGLVSGKYGDATNAAVTASIQTLMERIGAGKIVNSSLKAIGFGSKAIGSLISKDIKRTAINLGRGAIKKAESGLVEFTTEFGQELVGQIGKGFEIDGISGINKYLDLSQSWQAGRAGGIVGLTLPFTASIANQSVTEIRTAARKVAVNFDLGAYSTNVKAANAFFKEAQNALDLKLKNANFYTKEQHQEDSEGLAEIRNAGLKLPKGITEQNRSRLLDLMVERDKIKRKIQKINDSDLTQQEEKRLKDVKQKLIKEFDLINNEAEVIKVSGNVRSAIQKAAKNNKKIVEFFDFNNSKEVDDFADEVENGLTEKEKSSVKRNSSNYGTHIVINEGKPNEKEIIIINNQEASLGEGGINVAAHEYLHAVLRTTLKNSKGTALGLGKSLSEYLDSIDPNTTKGNNQFARRLKLYKEEPEATSEEEKLTLFSDAIREGKIKLNENALTKIGDIIRRTLQSLGMKNIKFNTGKDVYNFIRDYNASINKGKLNQAQEKLLDNRAEGDLVKREYKVKQKVKAKKSKKDLKEAYNELQQIDEIEANFTQQPEIREKQKNRKKELLKIVQDENAYEELRQIDEFEADFNPTEFSKNRKKELLDLINKEEEKEIIKFSKNEKASAEVQRLYNEKPRDWEVKVIEQMRPITAKLVERRRDVTGFDREELLRDFEVGERGILDLIRSYDPNKNDSLAAYINTFLSFRAQESSKRILKPVFESDVTEERGVAAQEDDISIEDAVDQSFKPTVEQKSKLRREIKLPDEQVEKVRQAVRKTFGTRLPDIDSPKFKKALRKAYDTELFKELKTNVFKTRDEYRSFLRENWKALYDAIPQETLNQSFATFREPVLDENGKQKREKTPEGERIFRKKNITKEEFLDYFFNPSVGGSTRGTRKDAIVRMLAQELGFDATMETIQEPKVAEKIAFANPTVTVPKLSEKADKDPNLKFSRKSAREFSSRNDLFSYDINTTEGARMFIRDIKEIIKTGKFPPGLLNPSMLISASYSKEVKAILRDEKNGLNSLKKEFGSNPIYAKTSPKSKFGTTGTEISKVSKEEFIEYNKRTEAMFKDFWFAINEMANDKELRKYGTTIYHMLNASVGSRNHPHSLGAEIVSIYNGKGKVTWEHAVPNAYAYDFLIEAAFNPEINFENAFALLKENYKLIALDKFSDKKVTKAGYSRKMPLGFDLLTGGMWWQRYLNTKVAELGGIRINDQNWFVKGENVFQEYTIDGTRETEIKSSKKSLSVFTNQMIENKTSIAASTTIGEARARIAGKQNKKFRFFVPPSADDFVGLLYYMVGKGKIGNEQLKWIKSNLIDPYAKAEARITAERIKITRGYKKLKKELGIIPKTLKKKIEGDLFTQEQAVRVYIWNQQKMTVPGLTKKEQDRLVKYINSNTELKKFADKLLLNNSGFGYAKPTESWTSGRISTDILESLNTTKRQAYLQQWQKNVDEVFSKENLNKLEAAFGSDYRYAMENILVRMKTGRNRQYGPDSTTGRLMNWINGSVGTIMFFNTRSAVLQTISSINFLNWQDNNIIEAGKAFANQPQYWSDFITLFNSDFLVNRRDGLRINVNEADLADVAKENGARGVISKLLKLGFAPTQLADSFAIASGGSTFYRNRIKSLMKNGLDKDSAEKQAFLDFRETAEESQQSSRPDKISQQQAGNIGRVILAFANTPSQYARITKKAFLDLKNRRGSDKANISMIVYYMAVQNLIFNALQQALFSLSFGDEEEDERKNKKLIGVANGMVDSVLRGLGFGGAIAATVKNVALKMMKEDSKWEEIGLEALKISPPIGSKVRKLASAGREYDWNKKEMKEKGLALDNPAIRATGLGVSAVTNVPLDRVVRKVENINAAINDDIEFYQRLALIGGWGKWELGIKDEKKKKTKSRTIEVKPREPFKN